MRKIILLIFFGLIVSINANDIFLDILLGKSVGTRSSEYVDKDNGSGNGYSSEGELRKGDIRVGYSFPLFHSFVVEPSLGWGILNGLNEGLNISGHYSLELPLLYKYKNIKYGAFARYNYLSGITVNDYDKSYKVSDQELYSYGLKLIFENKNINFLIAYEHLPNAVYEDTVVNGAQYTYTKIDIEGGYLSFGIRVKF